MVDLMVEGYGPAHFAAVLGSLPNEVAHFVGELHLRSRSHLTDVTMNPTISEIVNVAIPNAAPSRSRSQKIMCIRPPLVVALACLGGGWRTGLPQPRLHVFYEQLLQVVSLHYYIR
jgi:hypothetical protein